MLVWRADPFARFSEHVAKTLMTHRSEVEWIDSTEPLDTIIAQVKDSYRSKYPVCRGTMEEVEGTLDIRDLLERNHGHRRTVASLLGVTERTLYRKLRMFNLA